MKYLIVRGRDITEEKIAVYLPDNYEVIGATEDGVIIGGEDSHGWTADDYVIPRLASGLWAAQRLVEVIADLRYDLKTIEEELDKPDGNTLSEGLVRRLSSMLAYLRD